MTAVGGCLLGRSFLVAYDPLRVCVSKNSSGDDFGFGRQIFPVLAAKFPDPQKCPSSFGASAALTLRLTTSHPRVPRSRVQRLHRQISREASGDAVILSNYLIHEELLDELCNGGFQVAPGVIGENITTRGIDLLALPQGTRLYIGAAAIVGVTGLRDPCRQLNDYQPGLMAAVLGRDEQGNIIRKAGVMGVVLAAGEVRAGDPIRIELPPKPHQRLERV